MEDEKEKRRQKFFKDHEKEFQTNEQTAESITATSVIEQITQQEQEQTNVKANASDIFKDVFNIKKKEIKSHKANFLLTETNFRYLTELSKETGASRNELINRLIESCYKNSGLS